MTDNIKQHIIKQCAFCDPNTTIGCRVRIDWAKFSGTVIDLVVEPQPDNYRAEPYSQFIVRGDDGTERKFDFAHLRGIA